MHLPCAPQSYKSQKKCLVAKPGAATLEEIHALQKQGRGTMAGLLQPLKNMQSTSKEGANGSPAMSKRPQLPSFTIQIQRLMRPWETQRMALTMILNSKMCSPTPQTNILTRPWPCSSHSKYSTRTSKKQPLTAHIQHLNSCGKIRESCPCWTEPITNAVC